MRYPKVIVALFSLLLFLVPFLLWGNNYIVGGDDTRLYYIYPVQYIQNYAVNIISDNTLAGASTGYDSTAYHIPFFFVVYILQFLQVINPQMILYGLNFALGFLFFYLFLGMYLRKNESRDEAIKILASLFYVTSIYLIKTLYVNQLISVYLLAVIPTVLYLSVRGIRYQKMHLASVAAAVISIFSPVIVSLPWMAASALALSPLLLYEISTHWRSAIKYLTTFVLSFLIVNIYWLFHFINASVNGNGIGSNTSLYSSSSFLQENLRIINGVARLHSPLNQIFNTFDPNFLKNFYSLTTGNIVFLIVIIVAGMFLNKQNKKQIIVYAFGVVSLVLSVFLISPNFGDWSVKLFVFFSTHVPFFSMFRNMFDKFSIAMAFSYAFVFAISLSIVSQNLDKRKLFYPLCAVIVLLLINNSITFYRTNVNIERTSATVSGSFNKDFLALAEYVHNMRNASRVLWLPMNAPTYVFVKDEKLVDHYYSGLSPLRILANRSDYAGRFSFITQRDVFYGDRVFNLIKNKEYEKVGEIYQIMNAKYIIIDKQELPAELYDWYFSFFGTDMNKVQSGSYKDAILGKKIADFGQTYSLYEINSRYFTDKLYLTDSYANFPTAQTLSYEKKASYEYSITISSLNGKKKLVFLDPYYKTWTLYLNSVESKNKYASGKNVIVHDYANGWELDSEVIKRDYPKETYTTNSDGSINANFVLYFEPKSFDRFLYPISMLGFAAILIYQGYLLSKWLLQRRSNKKEVKR